MISLLEPDFQSLLGKHHIQTQKVHVPEGQSQPEIVQNILSLLDSANLAVFDLTPKATNPGRSVPPRSAPSAASPAAFC